MGESKMDEFTVEATLSEDDKGNESNVLADQTMSVLSMTECPSCHRKGTMEVFTQKNGKYAYCFSCGHTKGPIDS